MQQPPPFYYLDNFQRALDWIGERHTHLLREEEQDFLRRFMQLPQAARALLVRMVMRKGSLFRLSRLRYTEIGCTREAAAPLLDIGWVDAAPLLDIDQLFALLTKPELAAVFQLPPSHAARPKDELLERLRAGHTRAQTLEHWWPDGDDLVFNLQVDALCERLRLLFFGNGYQDWSEFVLADLGIFRYEQVELSTHSFAFRTRADVDDWLRLQACRERLTLGEPAAAILSDLPAPRADHPWLEARRAKLLFTLARELERAGEFAEALAIYEQCNHPEARTRRIRVLELLERHEQASTLALSAAAAPQNEAERQQLERMLPRLLRKAGLPKSPRADAPPIERFELSLPPLPGMSVEQVAARHLHRPEAPVRYVENTLLNALFGLLCWRALFAPVPGAFFHPFHAGPADLYSPDFRARRAEAFAHCLAELDDGNYRHTIRQTWRDKHGILSPFVNWDVIDEQLLELALACIAPDHLKSCFERMLFDLRANCNGLPDLIQFFPQARSYRLVEVKGPGDRLQDNQLRWFAHFATHGVPAQVCHVQWSA